MTDSSPYQGYLYAYPHKTAYRRLDPRPALRDVWAAETRDPLMLYVHLPFCEMRCGFCNLFTRANPPAAQVDTYLAQLTHEAAAVADALGDDARFARAAFGGGTPTYLEPAELDRVFDVLTSLGADLPTIGIAVETSPATATPDRMAVLKARGTTRVSIGVQSFLDTEARAAGRPQRRAEVEAALTAIRDAAIPILNIDLIYGIDGQTPETWRQSLDAALAWRPEELYLYPLYVRPLTGLGRRAVTRADWDTQRLALYRQAVAQLTAAGYEQQSMRMFRRGDLGSGGGVSGAEPQAPGGGVSGAEPQAPGGDEYSCQDDGAVGLGCGARSYTRDLHYSFDYAVSVSGVRAVLDDYLGRPAADFRYAEVGYRLDAAEQRRRWLLKSLLRVAGVDRAAYRERFGTDVCDDFPELRTLADDGLVTVAPTQLVLTAAGLERSDAIGPWLVSTSVRDAMAEYALR